MLVVLHSQTKSVGFVDTWRGYFCHVLIVIWRIDMSKILLIDKDEHFLELARLSLEELLEAEILTVPTDTEALNILKKGLSFNLIISDYQKEVLSHLVSKNSTIPFFYFTDEQRIEIPFTPTMFIGIFRKNQFKELCDSVIHLLKKKE